MVITLKWHKTLALVV